MLSPQRTAAVASRGAGEASNFPRTRSVVTYAAFQCFGSEVTSRPCRRLFFPFSFFGVATGGRTAGCLSSEFRAGAPGAGKVLTLSREPAASCGLRLGPVELRPVQGRACRAVARPGSGSETRGPS